MPLFIPDYALKEAGLSEREALIEFTCRLFEAGRIELPTATRLAGLPRPPFVRELAARCIPAYFPTVQDLQIDMATSTHLQQVRRQRAEDGA